MLKLILISYKNLFRYVIKMFGVIKNDKPLNILEAVFYFWNIIEFIFFIIFQMFYIPIFCLSKKQRLKYFIEIVD